MIYSSFVDLSPILQSLLATSFTWFVTAVGAALVFLLKGMNRKIFDGMLGFAAGVMLAASYWSLLSPAIELSAKQELIPWIPVAIGFLLGGIFIKVIDKIIPHIHPNLPPGDIEGPKTKLKKDNLLVLAITIHNIPEGLAIGVAFGAASLDLPEATLGAAISLAIGIGLQNLPEGFAVSMPLKQGGYSSQKSFFYGQLSASVEPVAGVLGALFVFIAQPLLPYILSFAAGAMIFVVAEEVIPESHRRGNIDFATLFLLFGFVLMMILDVELS